jgi:hypothetical protein
MNNRKTSENRDTPNNKPIETDSSEIVRQHLEDENHEITDEDIRNVKIVGTEGNEPVTTGAEIEARFGTTDSKVGDDNDTLDPNDRPVTPWDVVSE